MAYKTRRMLEEELADVRHKLEEARDLIDEALGLNEDDEDDSGSEDDEDDE